MVWGVSHTPTKVSHFPSQNSQKDAMIPNKETVVETDVGQYIKYLSLYSLGVLRGNMADDLGAPLGV